MKRFIINLFTFQLLILFAMYWMDGALSLLGYINTSFFTGGLLLLAGGIAFIFRTGSFDFFVRSSRKMIARKEQREAIESMRAPSEIFSKSPIWFFSAGLPIFILMLIALAFYYV